MTTESVGSCAGSSLNLAGPMSPFREGEENFSQYPRPPPLQGEGHLLPLQARGHWAVDCPNKNKDSPASSPNKAFPKCPQKYPELRCRICGEPCVVRTSGTDKNPCRDFYTCARDSNMFQWCDERGKIQLCSANSPLKPAPQCGAAALQNPECTCTAGPCRVKTKPNGRQYFVCHLKSGQGACVHFKWCDGLGDDVDLNNNLTTEELKNAATNNHQEIKVKEKDEEIVVPTGPPPPLPLAELEADSVGVGSSLRKRLNFMEGSPSKHKCIEDLTSERVTSPSLNCYLNEEPNNLQTNKGAASNRDNTDSGETLVLDSRPTPPLQCSPMKRLSLNEGNLVNPEKCLNEGNLVNPEKCLNEGNSANPEKCVLCKEVGHVVTECPVLAIMW